MNNQQNTIYYDAGFNNPEYIYPMRGDAWHVHAFSLPVASLVKISVSLVTVNCEDETLQGYFSDTPHGQDVFYGNSKVSPFVVKKNYSFDELYQSNKGNTFVIFDETYDAYNDEPVTQAITIKNQIFAQQDGPDPIKPSYTPVRKIEDIASRLILKGGIVYYINLHNLQNKDKIYKLKFSNTIEPSTAIPNKCIDNFKKTDQSNLYQNFRYPSSNRPTW